MSFVLAASEKKPSSMFAIETSGIRLLQSQHNPLAGVAERGGHG
jgi:hypothetical protein